MKLLVDQRILTYAQPPKQHSGMNWYDRSAKQIRSERYVFMNHGYANPNTEDDFTWVQPLDRDQRFAANLVRHLVRDMDLTDKTIVDVGCGRGGACSYLARHHSPGAVIGVDICAGNLEFCRRVHSFPRVKFLNANAECLPFDEDSIDVVINIESCHRYPNKDRFLNEVRRVLKPQGVFCHTDTFPAIPAALWGKVLRRVGFSVKDETDITQNVIAAIERGGHQMRAFFDHMIQDESADAEILNELYNQITGGIRRSYEDGRSRYLLWRLINRSSPAP